MSDPITRLNAALEGRYRIERELGEGGMATVYLAEDLKHPRRVAIKVFKPEGPATLPRDRFLREIEAVAKLSHPHIVPLYDSADADGLLYYVMPHLRGGSLRRQLDDDRQLPIDRAVLITRQVASALEHAHGHGLIHRDIKPENILFHESEAMVTDFGIALATEMPGPARLTDEGTFLGTPAYMSPEQATGENDLGVPSDVYSLACVLYEMLAGDPPHLGSSVHAIIARIITEQPTRISTLRGTVPFHVDEALNRALAKGPVDRFASAAAFAGALTTAPAGNEGHAKTIVVLPFADRSPDRDNEHFSDGLTDEIIADLSQVHELRVISGTSAMLLKGTSKDVKAIAQELQVRYVLEGSVRKAGERLRITARLIDAEEDAQLWAGKHDGVLDNVFEVQERVSRAITDALALKLSPEENRQISQRPMIDVRAFEYHLQGRFAYSHGTEESIRRAIQHFAFDRRTP
jgi:serine/threonine protein kinase